MEPDDSAHRDPSADPGRHVTSALEHTPARNTADDRAMPVRTLAVAFARSQYRVDGYLGTVDVGHRSLHA